MEHRHSPEASKHPNCKCSRLHAELCTAASVRSQDRFRNEQKSAVPLIRFVTEASSWTLVVVVRNPVIGERDSGMALTLG